MENSGVTTNWKRSVFIPIPKKGNGKECSNYYTIALISHASKILLKILQARHQLYVNRELPDVQVGFRKGRGTIDQIATIHPWDSPGKNTGVGCHFLLQEIFLTQGSNPSVLHCRQILYHLSHQGSPEHAWENPILVQFSSITQSCPTLCNPMNHSTPVLPVHHQLLEFTQTHVHWVSDAIQQSHPLSSPSPVFNLSQHQGLFKWVSSSHQVAKVLEFQLQHQSFQWTFRTDFL